MSFGGLILSLSLALGWNTFLSGVTREYAPSAGAPSQSGTSESCVPEAVLLSSPSNGSNISASQLTLSWNSAVCGTGYRLQYSLDPSFPGASTVTVTLDLPFVSATAINLPNKEARIYWHVFTLADEKISPPSETWFFDSHPSDLQMVTSAKICLPVGGDQFSYGYELQPSCRVTSMWGGDVSGNWILDGVTWAPFQATVQSNGDNVLLGPALPTTQPGNHSLQVSITAPNPILSNVVTYTVEPAEYGLSNSMVVTASPSRVSADGVSTSSITIVMVDDQGRRVWNDNGWAGYAILMLSGTAGGSLPNSADFNLGQATATYTSGTANGTAHITVYAWMQMGLASTSIEIDVGPPVSVGLAKHDYCRNYLSWLRMDMFAGPFDFPVTPASMDPSHAEVFVQSQIRDKQPTELQLESFERLCLAEEVLVKGYRFNPANPNPLGGTEYIGGAEELAFAAVRNLSALIGGALEVYFFADKWAAEISKIPFVGELLGDAMRWLAGKLLSWSLEVIGGVTSLIGDTETRQTADGLFDLLQTTLKTAIDDHSVFEILETPVVTSPVTGLFLSNYVGKFQPQLDAAAQWSTQDHANGTIAAARAYVENNLADLARNSHDALGTIASYENQYQVGLTEVYQSVNDLVTNPNWMNFTGLRDNLMTTMGNFIGTQKVVFGEAAAAEALTAYGTNRAFVSKGIANAYGEAPLEIRELAQPQLARSKASRRGNALGSMWLADAVSQSQFHSKWVLAAKAVIDTRDTAAGLVVAESLMAVVDDWAKPTDAIVASTQAARDSAEMAIPGFDSLYSDLIESVHRAKWSQTRGVLAFEFYLANASDVAFAHAAHLALDSSVFLTSQAESAMGRAQQAVFLSGSMPMVIVDCIAAKNHLEYGDTLEVPISVRNVGGSSADGYYLSIAVEPPLEFIGQVTVPLADLEPGDSTELVVKALAGWDSSDTSASRIASMRVQPHPGTGLAVAKSFSVRVFRSCCVGSRGNVDVVGIVDAADLSALVSYMTGGGLILPCTAAANIDNRGIVDSADLSALVSYLTGGGYQLGDCP